MAMIDRRWVNRLLLSLLCLGTFVTAAGSPAICAADEVVPGESSAESPGPAQSPEPDESAEPVENAEPVEHAQPVESSEPVEDAGPQGNTTEPTPETPVGIGWVEENGKRYYITADGSRYTGWLDDGGSRFYLGSDGAMATGWVRPASTWFYFDTDGAMQTGWVWTGSWYYLNPDGVWLADVLVNKQNPLQPAGFVPPLVSVAGGQMMHPEAADAMSRMLAAARADGIIMEVGSGYRSYSTQSALFWGYAAQSGVAAAETFSARPGHSEHQTGLAADMRSPREGCYVTQCFGNTNAGRWVAANAWRYGFIVRYPSGYTHITGFIWEPWHVRYVGTGISTDMHYRAIPTYEQYLAVPAAPHY